jgi:hypothetical protein
MKLFLKQGAYHKLLTVISQPRRNYKRLNSVLVLNISLSDFYNTISIEKKSKLL